jgi:DNA-binding winged helix-turn-helix (wHTH) protein/Tfp pilus assembly protein PilF
MRRVTFGPFRLDLDSHELQRSGIAVRLQPQPAKLLAMLVQRGGELVTRDEIRAALWAADTFVDFDQSVNFCIRQIRTALRDNADTPCYIETLPRQGYRFIAPVHRDATEAKTASGRYALPARATWRRTGVVASMAVIVVCALAAAGMTLRHIRPSGESSARSRAYQEVQLGRFFLDKWSATDTQRALEHFQAAIENDPNYAPAYAGLGEAYNLSGSVFIARKPPANVRLLALRAAIRAIELDPRLPEGYAVLGYTALHEMDWNRADAALRRAIELDPRNMRAHLSYASYLVARRRFADAIAEAHRGVDLEPTSIRARQAFAWMLYFNRQYDDATRELHTIVQMDPTYAMAHFRLGQVFIVTNRWDEAIPELQTTVDLTHRAPAALGLLAMAHGGRGDRAEAQQIVDELEARSANETVPAGAVLLAYIGNGDKQRAIDAVATSYAERDNYVINIAADPLMDPLRKDSRFEALCEQVLRGTRLAILDRLMPEISVAQR